jgi:hypothetical protein
MPGLSKSRLASFLQCPRKLWLEVHRRDLAEPVSPSQQAIFDTGHAVGELARRLYDPGGRGVLIDGGGSMTAALAETAAAVAADPVRPFFEATFERDGLLVRADVLLPDRPHGARLVEVKSAASVKPEHVTDVAIQAWVLAASPLPPAAVAVAHVDSGFVYGGDGDYTGLLVEADLTEAVATPLAQVPRWLADAQAVLAGPEPHAEIGSRCSAPYDCPFRAHCWPATEHPVTSLPRLGGRRLDELLARGVFDVRDLPPAEVPAGDAKRVWRAARTGRPELDQAALKALRELAYPRYYLDFETIGPAVPRWAGLRPYQPVPFQWSLHGEPQAGVLTHAEFLDTSGTQPARAAAAALLAAAGTAGPVVVWSGYEARCLNELATLCPDLAGPLQALRDRLVDIQPVVRRGYYHPAMRGRWSIKAVLPTLAPELDYAQLDGVQDGAMAQQAYLLAIDPATDAPRRAQLRAQLLRYCAQDTLAMVRVVQALS